jgi:hypothetical protein
MPQDVEVLGRCKPDSLSPSIGSSRLEDDEGYFRAWGWPGAEMHKEAAFSFAGLIGHVNPQWRGSSLFASGNSRGSLRTFSSETLALVRRHLKQCVARRSLWFRKANHLADESAMSGRDSPEKIRSAGPSYSRWHDCLSQGRLQ